MPRRSSRRSGRGRRRCCSATRATRPATRPRRRTWPPSSPSRSGTGSSIVTDEAYEASLWDGAPFTSAFGLGDDVIVIRSLGKSLSMPQLRLGLLAGPAERVARCTRTLEWDCLRVNVASQEAARAALEGPRGWLEQIHAATAADRAVAIAAVAATPGLTAATPFAAPFLFVGSSGRGARGAARGRRAPRRRRRCLRGPGLRQAAVRRSGRGARRRCTTRSPAGPSSTLDESARSPAPDRRPDRSERPRRRRAGTVPVRAPLDAAQPWPLAADGGDRGRARLRAAAPDRDPRRRCLRQHRPAAPDAHRHRRDARLLRALSRWPRSPATTGSC